MEEALEKIHTHHCLQAFSLSPPAEGRAEAPQITGYRRVTLNLPADLVEQLRNTVYWTPGVTLTGLIKAALHESLERLERRNGRRYPARLGELKSGRPRKVEDGAVSRRPNCQLTHSPTSVATITTESGGPNGARSRADRYDESMRPVVGATPASPRPSPSRPRCSMGGNPSPDRTRAMGESGQRIG